MVSLAAFFQLKRAEFTFARIANSFRNVSSFSICSNPYAIEFVLWGSTNTPASPATSGREELEEVNTGTPKDIASTKGSPKPSYKEGIAKKRACAYKVDRCSSLT